MSRYYSNDPVRDAANYYDDMCKESDGIDAAVATFLKDAHPDLVLEGLDLGKGPTTNQVIDLVILAAQGEDIRAKAADLMDLIANKWVEFYPERAFPEDDQDPQDYAD